MSSTTASFRDLFIDGWRVEIPLIQRDYAQGRDDAHGREVRRRFVAALVGALAPDARTLDLDFVYGRFHREDRTLEPLDGQQRLTTLFLLHWYLASRDDAFAEFAAWLVGEGGRARFSYRTRPAARDLFDALVVQPAPVSELVASGRPPSAWATNAAWFEAGWRRDPTVRGCLIMLDALHGHLAGGAGSWARLVEPEAPAIVFQLLPLDDFGLADDLYIKMNARGKALTPFEILKAELEGFADQAFANEPCSASPALTWPVYLGQRLDGSWTDFLWRRRGGATSVDAPFVRRSRRWRWPAAFDLDDEDLADRLDLLLVAPEPGIPLYRELGCLDRAFLEGLARVLNGLAAAPEGPAFLGRTGYLDEAGLLDRMIGRGDRAPAPTLTDRALFYAWCVFLERFATELDLPAARAWLHDWLRMIANLVRNTDVDRAD